MTYTETGMLDWFSLPELEIPWLIDGLLPADGHNAIIGKPKTAKSTLVRNLAVRVIKGKAGGEFLNRAVEIPTGTGRVLYLHLDRKDPVWRVGKELRKLGITKDEKSRLIIKTAQHLPDTYPERLEWLKKEVSLVNEFGNLAWPTSAVCFGPPLGTLMLRELGSAGA